MSHMTEEEKKQIEVLLKCCRKQCTMYDKKKQDWEELVKAKEERLQQEKKEVQLKVQLVNNSLRPEGQEKRHPL